MIVSTQASAHAPLPDFVPPSTRRFVIESGTASHRADVGCVSDRSVEWRKNQSNVRIARDNDSQWIVCE